MSRNNRPAECHGTSHPVDSENAVTCCQEAEALLAACGEHFELYSRKLSQRGWPGQLSAVELAYVRSHRSEARSEAAKAAGERLAKSRFLPPKPTTQKGLRLQVVVQDLSVSHDDIDELSDGLQMPGEAA